MQCTTCFRPTANIAKTKELVGGIPKLIHTIRPPRAADDDVHGGIGDHLDLYMHAAVEWNAGEVWIHPTDEDWI